MIPAGLREKNLLISKDLIKKNYPQLVMVFAAFLLMILMGSFFMGRILRNRLRAGAEEALFAVEGNIKAGLAEAEVTLHNSYYIVRNMINQGASQQEVLDYLKGITGWMRQRSGGLMEFYGIYGYIRGEFIDSIGLGPGKEYVPQRQPWYQTAVRSGTRVGYTVPYRDERTGEMIISAVRNLDTPEGEIYGILAVDIDIAWLVNYTASLKLAPGGYGMLISRNMTLMGHPSRAYLGSQMRDLASSGGSSAGKAYIGISQTLWGGGEVSGLRIVDTSGVQVTVFFRRMVNGWYVGIVTPYRRFYQDLFYAIAVLTLLGFIMAGLLSYILLRLSAAKARSDEENKSKSSFLTRMSHDIRTPMNAIIGMSELALREDLSERCREYVSGIRQAGDNLLSIIDDILDFSKIESGKLEIVNADYFFPSLLNDIISITRVHLYEKPVLFVTRIEGSLPLVMRGDEFRIRQILLNILDNAVKYTKEGSITLSIKNSNDAKPGAGDTILLSFEIADTGVGIKPEDREKLFEGFSWIDTKINRDIEGIGLGLTIARNFCVLMGGNITVDSSYGQGSVFTVNLPQKVVDATPFARVENPETKSVLVYGGSRIQGESIAYTADKLGVPCAMASNPADFLEQLKKHAWGFVFTSSLLFDKVREILGESPETALVLLAEYGETARAGVRVLSLPVHPVSLANILNGKRDNKVYNKTENPEFRFTAPDARVLIVDDIATNLSVAKGLLSPYKMRIDCCGSGLEALRLAEQNRYDLVFLDHMMPGMDGIETAAAIRALDKAHAKDLPLVALTANAIAGMREMFLEKGFNDYLAKPIEIAKMENILEKWIPKSKQRKPTGSGREIKTEDRAEPGEPPPSPGENSQKAADSAGKPPFFIEGLDTARGIVMTGGTEAGYRGVLAAYYQDALERLPLLEKPPEKGELPSFVIQVHALKSASASIGAADLSKEAMELETAGKAGDLPAIREKLPGFREKLRRLTGELEKSGVLEEPDINEEDSASETEGAFLPLLVSLREAFGRNDLREIDRLVEKLENAAPAGKEKKLLSNISDKLLMAEYDEAREALEEFLG
ncbi:MAG: response regulator [Treponema sp.]|jgi:signal transduction histidine kinase/CheY-like chemotaxis protein/HPt (histidine-containing phosphotransfer) domain-containing protein|nr:response regulator [Treponema sp.]